MSNRLRKSHGTIDTRKVLSGSIFRAAALHTVLVVGITSCVSTIDPWTRFEHAERGYSVPYPQSLTTTAKPAWRQLKVKDADLAFGGPRDAFMAITSHCDEPNADPAVLGRQLLVGLKNRSSVSSETFEFAGGQAFSQIVESTEDDSAVRTKTVTLVRGGCVVDWVLTVPGPLADAEAVFDEWWQGFDPGSMPGPTDDVSEASP